MENLWVGGVRGAAGVAGFVHEAVVPVSPPVTAELGRRPRGPSARDKPFPTSVGLSPHWRFGRKAAAPTTGTSFLDLRVITEKTLRQRFARRPDGGGGGGVGWAAAPGVLGGGLFAVV